MDKTKFFYIAEIEKALEIDHNSYVSRLMGRMKKDDLITIANCLRYQKKIFSAWCTDVFVQTGRHVYLKLQIIFEKRISAAGGTHVPAHLGDA